MLIDLGTLRDYWKNVSDWVLGGSSRPKVGIDQTTDGTTNRVVSKISQTEGENVVSFGTTAQPVAITGSLPNQTLVEQLTETDAILGVLTFSANIACIEIYNTDATNSGTFTVNGIDIVVPAAKTFMAPIGGTTSAIVSITGATTYIVSRYV